ncbi:MAG: nicotinate (nicotinamide) nucleotide adenylyltransferase [Alicyclobacillus sp.]|nr:nicotinate (nicotinamide) nucleotide adenylyltransferase [Alicyclobacillus sp.]
MTAFNPGSRVVLFGGTFDPPHVGHLLMAQLAYEQAAASAVWWLPAPAPPHKQASDAAWRYDLRRRMVEALIQPYAYFALCDVEAELPRPSYTVDTVHAAQTRYPDTEFLFLIGSDSLAQLPAWGRAAELAACIVFWVAERPGFPWREALATARQALPGLRVHRLEGPQLDVSSTFLRQRLYAGLPTCGLIPEAVLAVWHTMQP